MRWNATILNAMLTSEQVEKALSKGVSTKLWIACQSAYMRIMIAHNEQILRLLLLRRYFQYIKTATLL